MLKYGAMRDRIDCLHSSRNVSSDPSGETLNKLKTVKRAIALSDFFSYSQFQYVVRGFTYHTPHYFCLYLVFQQVSAPETSRPTGEMPLDVWEEFWMPHRRFG